MWPWGAIGIVLAVLVGIGVLKDILGIVEPRRGYSEEWCERYLGRIKVGGETLTGRFVEVVHGCDSYLIMTRNDDLDPPHQIVRTIMCPTCEMIVLPMSGCKCNVTRDANDQWLLPVPIFKQSSPGSLTHEWFAGYPERKSSAKAITVTA